MSTFTQPITDSDRTLTAIRTVIGNAYAWAPRSQQRSIGPSQVGDPCARKLAYTLLGLPAINTGTDPLPSAVGTGAHAWLADAFTLDNKTLGRVRWHVETKVQCGPVAGSCDLYDADTRTVIDHKFPGETAMKKYRANGPSDVYRVQAHLYGLGHATAGRAVDTVGIVFYPRGGNLRNAFIWTVPYDEQVAHNALARLESIATATDLWAKATGGDLNQVLAAIPATTSYLCGFCPHFTPNPTPELLDGCPGEQTYASTHQQRTLT